MYVPCGANANSGKNKRWWCARRLCMKNMFGHFVAWMPAIAIGLAWKSQFFGRCGTTLTLASRDWNLNDSIRRALLLSICIHCQTLHYTAELESPCESDKIEVGGCTGRSKWCWLPTCSPGTFVCFVRRIFGCWQYKLNRMAWPYTMWARPDLFTQTTQQNKWLLRHRSFLRTYKF